MEGKRTIRKIRLENFLSYGSEGQEIELEPLNVLIGPNASGKSNFIEALRFLNAVPTTDLGKPLREGGGANEYLWKGNPARPVAKIEVILEDQKDGCGLTYAISFTADDWGRLFLAEEKIECEDAHLRPSLVYHYPNKNRQGVLSVEQFFRDESGNPQTAYVDQEISIDGNRSILGWVRNPIQYPELAHLEKLFLNLQFAGEWQLSRYSPSRLPQRTDLQTDVLLEDASNLGLIINNYSNREKQEIIEAIKQVGEEFGEIRTRVQGNTIQTFIQEQGLFSSTPATRLSDGTLRYLCLLTLLKQPELPPVLCIEEPEAGLHPDVIHSVAELLVEASQRTQIIVTTHSSSLVSALSNTPESVIVCERESTSTTLQRLDPERLAGWLERYELGELWEKGVFGGNRP